MLLHQLPLTSCLHKQQTNCSKALRAEVVLGASTPQITWALFEACGQLIASGSRSKLSHLASKSPKRTW